MVSLERKVCIVTGELYETGDLIMPKVITKEEQPMYLTTGYGLSKPCQDIVDKGYVYVVEGVKTSSGVDLSGRNAAVRREVAEDMFKAIKVQDVQFCDKETMDWLEGLYNKIEKEDEDN